MADPRLIQLARDHPDYQSKCVPMVLHGDGVPCTKNNTLDRISFESLLAKSGLGTACNTQDYIFFITRVFTQTMDKTNDAGYRTTQQLKCESLLSIRYALAITAIGQIPAQTNMHSLTLNLHILSERGRQEQEVFHSSLGS